MTMLSFPVTAQLFCKTKNAIPGTGTAGENIAIMEPIYLDTGSADYKVGDSYPTDVATSKIVGIAFTKSETGFPVLVYEDEDIIIDVDQALTPGQQYYLVGKGGIGEYSDVPLGDYLVRLGYSNEDGDFVVDIEVTGEIK